MHEFMSNLSPAIYRASRRTEVYAAAVIISMIWAAVWYSQEDFTQQALVTGCIIAFTGWFWIMVGVWYPPTHDQRQRAEQSDPGLLPWREFAMITIALLAVVATLLTRDFNMSIAALAFTIGTIVRVRHYERIVPAQPQSLDY
ncbi:MAG: hypothetical protein ABIQ64_02700 [Candidatus Saccharimonadales bacterium]